jgi:hypothetical protein
LDLARMMAPPRKGRTDGWAVVKRPDLKTAEGGRAPQATAGGQGVPMELQEIVGGRDEPPFRAGGGPTAAFEPPDPAVRLDLAEDRLDDSRLRE